jgi:hypothetical protein
MLLGFTTQGHFPEEFSENTAHPALFIPVEHSLAWV